MSRCKSSLSALISSCEARPRLFPVLPGVGSLLARFQLTEGPSKPAPLAVQFTSEGSTLSGCDIELAGPGYRFSLIKKRFAAGQSTWISTSRDVMAKLQGHELPNAHIYTCTYLGKMCITNV